MTNEMKGKTRFTFASAALMIAFFAGLVLTILSIYLYRVTVISWTVPFLIWLVAGLALLPFLRGRLSTHLKMNGLFYQVIYSGLGFGGIVLYLVMAMNYYTVSGTSTTYKLNIIEKSSMPGTKGRRSERHPLVRVQYFDREKELVFDYADTRRVELADSATVEVKRGGLGFDVLVSYNVVER
jgi:hypothetical protein